MNDLPAGSPFVAFFFFTPHKTQTERRQTQVKKEKDMFRMSGMNFAPDAVPGGAPAASGTGNVPGVPETNAGAVTSVAPETAQNNGNPPAAHTPITFASEADLQREIETRLKDRLTRERKKAEEDSRRAADEAAAEAAKKNGEWEKLAQQREAELKAALARVAELDPKATRYEESLKKALEAQKAGLPAHITALLDRLDVADQLEYLAANREAIGKATSAPPPAAGIPATPTAANNGADQAALDAERKRFERSIRNLF